MRSLIKMSFRIFVLFRFFFFRVSARYRVLGGVGRLSVARMGPIIIAGRRRVALMSMKQFFTFSNYSAPLSLSVSITLSLSRVSSTSEKRDQLVFVRLQANHKQGLGL